MFERISHVSGMVKEDEILFSTRFDYLFPEAARSPLCLLPQSEASTAGLRALGTAMATDDFANPDPNESQIPAVYTYFGQFIDHDTTARTDRDGDVTSIGNYEPVGGLDPDLIITKLKNGRRPELDLDCVFGDGPALAAQGNVQLKPRTESQVLYDDQFKMRLFDQNGRRDLIRSTDRSAVIPDARNDENLNVSQLQCAMIAFYNKAYDAAPGNPELKHIRARRLCRWAFQYVTINDYLMTVCDPMVVQDTLLNGPRFLGAAAGRQAFMPLEFSAAGFRFAHSMIRPSYRPNGGTQPQPIMNLLGFASKDAFFAPAPNGFEQLKAEFVIDWNYFVAGGTHTQFARKIDTRISMGLGELPFAARSDDPILGHLARSNLMRAKNLSIPTGQAMADAFGVFPLTPKDILDGDDPAISAVVKEYFFHHRSPLWYYVLLEAKLQQQGQRLGEVGSRIVCETIVGMIKQDPNSYLHNRTHPDVTNDGIRILNGPNGVVSDIASLLKVAGVY